MLPPRSRRLSTSVRRAVSTRARARITAATLSFLLLSQFILAPSVRANNTAQSPNPPFTQDWSNAGLVTANDDWSGVPGIVGFLGDYTSGSPTGVDPRTLVQDMTTADVIANQSNPSAANASGGVAEFDGIADRTMALNGSGTADAPNLVLYLNTTGLENINVAYLLRDLDASGDDAVQQVALQYRVGGSGNYTNVPAGYVNDATTGPLLATLVTPVSVTLPAAASNQSLVQVRVMTTNAAGNDEWVGVDNIAVSGTPVSNSTNPAGTGVATPNTVAAGNATTLTVAVTPGTNPASGGINVTADLSSIGGSPAQAFNDDGGNSFSFSATIAQGTTPGAKSLPVTITDAQNRSGNVNIDLTVEQPVVVVEHVVISQIYGAGGNSGAAFNRDFVELYNPGTQTFDLTGWSLQYASATGDGWVSNRQPLGGAIAPGEYYLVALASGANGSALPAPNISGAINLSGTTGKIALVSNFDELEGSCPLGDPDLVDLVGYGTTANCSETNRAAAPSAANAIFRKGNGATDTGNNQADFITGAPNPRRTAPIVEIGPSVFGTDPRFNGFNAPRDASITINFTEPVDVTGSWFNVNCATTGQHNDATFAGGGDTHVITPNANFQPGEQCTVTVFKDFVHDQDTDDAGPNADTLHADFTWTFTVSNGTAPPYPPSVHLTMGNPNGATADLGEPNNFLMEKPEFALSYNRDKGTPNWVSWHLSDEWVGTLSRVDTFRPDPSVPSDWYRVQATDYSGSGFDRGHMVPNADRDKETSVPINQATFLMTNMLPQAPDNNQGPWANMENALRDIVNANNELYIVAGGAGAGGTGSAGAATAIAGGRVHVPAQTWKVVLVLPKGEDDLSRVGCGARTIAVVMPNVQGIRNNDWQSYITTVDAVESLTGYDFFANLPDAVENCVEAGTNGANPPGTAGQSVIAQEDTPESITLEAAGPNSIQLAYTIVNGPAHGTLTGTNAARVYTPAANYHGPDSFTFKVSDGQRESNVSTVSISVSEVNDAPTLAHVGDHTVLLGGTLVFNAAGSDADVPAQTLAYSLTGVVPAGASINPTTGVFTWTPSAAQVGQVYVFGVRVTDGPGLFAEEAVRVGVGYNWSGVLQPLNADGSSVFKLGRTVPVKFRLTGPSAGITNAVARLYVARMTGDVVGTEEEADSTSNATEGNLFRYSGDGQYVFNLSTDGLAAGTYQLRIDLGDGVPRVVGMSLR